MPQVHSHPQFASDCAFLYLGNALKEMTGKVDCKTPRKSFQKFSTAEQFFCFFIGIFDLHIQSVVFCESVRKNANSKK